MSMFSPEAEIKVINLFDYRFWKISKFPNDIFVRTDTDPEIELTNIHGKKIGFSSAFTGSREMRRGFIRRMKRAK